MTNEERFVNELIGYIFAYPDDDYMTMECLCRKLHKHGLLDKKDGEWIGDFIERAEQTEPQDGLLAEVDMIAAIIIIILLLLFDALLFISCWALEREEEERENDRKRISKTL